MLKTGPGNLQKHCTQSLLLIVEVQSSKLFKIEKAGETCMVPLLWVPLVGSFGKEVVQESLVLSLRRDVYFV